MYTTEFLEDLIKHTKITIKNSSQLNDDEYQKKLKQITVILHNWMRKKYPKIYNDCIIIFGKNFSAILLYNDIHNVSNICDICGKEKKFHNFRHGYNECVNCFNILKQKLKMYSKKELYHYIKNTYDKKLLQFSYLQNQLLLTDIINWKLLKNLEDLYLYLNDTQPYKCDVCGKSTLFKSFTETYNGNNAYNQFCCMSCRHKWWSQSLHVNNTSHRSTPDVKLAAKEKLSLCIKKKISSGEWTPAVTNSWCHSKIILSYKVNNTIKTIKVRSCWEAMFILLHPHLEYEKLRIPYFSPKKLNICNYIVDFIDISKKIVYEVKPQSKIHDIENIAKADALQKWCEQNNFTCMYITEQQLQQYEFHTSLLQYTTHEYQEKIIKNLKKYPFKIIDDLKK